MPGDFFYATSYSAIARNVSSSDLGLALSTVPLDTASEDLIGLELLSDSTVLIGARVTRSLVYTSKLLGQICPDPQIGQFLESQYKALFSQALSTPVVQSPVLITPRFTGTLLWANAQFGAPDPVAFWTNLTGGASELAQVTSLHQATLNPDGAGDGVSTVDFTGAAPDFLQSTDPFATDAFTYAVTIHGSGTAGNILERSANATIHDGELLFSSEPASIEARRSATTGSANAPAGWATDGAWHVAQYTYSAAAGGVLLVDGVSVASFAGLPATAVSATLYVGARSDATLGITAKMRELFLIDHVLTAEELASQRAAMGAQVGLS